MDTCHSKWSPGKSLSQAACNFCGNRRRIVKTSKFIKTLWIFRRVFYVYTKLFLQVMISKLSGWDDTIVALATPPGVGAIGVIRLSGERTFEIVNALFPSKDLLQELS